jgi:hypothetical protein
MVHSYSNHPASVTPSAEERTNSMFFKVMETTPMGLLIGAALGLVIAGVFQYIFYLSILPSSWSLLLRTALSTGLALFFELLAFYFLVATVRDFSSGAKREGWIGVSASILLLSYCTWEAIHIASVFDNNTPEGFWAICSILGTIILAVRVVELRITLTVSSAYKQKDRVQELQSEILNLTEQLARTSEQLQHYLDIDAEAEEKRIRLAQLEAEEAQREKEEQYRQAQQELARLRKRSEASGAENRKQSISQAEILKVAFRHFDPVSGKLKVTREVIAAELKTTTRTISEKFKNGTLEAALKHLAEKRQQASEISEETL